MKINIVLVEPQIHSNTGNIARTCAVTGASLHLVKPLGFSVDDAKLKRAGLDYWDKLDITYYSSLSEFMRLHVDDTLIYFSTKSPHCYSEVNYPANCFLVFGREDQGLPEDLLKAHLDETVRIPMRNSLRSLNLSNSVAIAVYEAFRKNKFEGLEQPSGYFDY